MNTTRKFWLVLGAAVAAFAVIACSCSQFNPLKTATPTVEVPIYIPPTEAPIYIPPTEAPVTANYEGFWMDPDTAGGTVTSIIRTDYGFAVDAVMNGDRGGNELTSYEWSNGVLTWTYCVPDGYCVTSQTISVDGDSLYTSWTNDHGGSGTTTMLRTSGLPIGNETAPEPIPGLAGFWSDPDTTGGTVTSIIYTNGGYAVDAVVNGLRGGNELTSYDWSGGVLTWTYCVPDGYCVTSQTISVDGDSLYTSWTNDHGGSGYTTMNRAMGLP